MPKITRFKPKLLDKKHAKEVEKTNVLLSEILHTMMDIMEQQQKQIVELQRSHKVLWDDKA